MLPQFDAHHPARSCVRIRGETLPRFQGGRVPCRGEEPPSPRIFCSAERSGYCTTLQRAPAPQMQVWPKARGAMKLECRSAKRRFL